jgi:ribosome-binding protein aMBF1 (putative translation factor)
MSKCKVCKKETDTLRSIIHDGKILSGCDNCLDSQIAADNDRAAKGNREYQRSQYRKDLLQPFQPEYARAYPDKFREKYGDETYRLLG